MSARDVRRAIEGDPGTGMRHPTLRKSDDGRWYLADQGRRIWLPGSVAYAEVTSEQSSITTETDITGLSVTFDSPANRRLKITHHCISFHGTNADDRFQLRITDDANARVQARNLRINATGVQGGGGPMVAVVTTGSGGSLTYKVRALRVSGSGSGVHIAAATAPAFILVEDIGQA